MKTVEIIGYKRANLGKTDSNALRLEGLVPCVLYGGKDQIHFQVPMSLFKSLVYTPDAQFVSVDIEGDERRCVLQAAQFHPVSDIVLHADFLELRDDRPIKMEIPVEPVGLAPGVSKGGKLLIKQRKLRLKGFPNDLPDKIQVDVSHLELGKSVKVKELPEGKYTILTGPSNPVITIEIPRALRGKKAE